MSEAPMSGDITQSTNESSSWEDLRDPQDILTAVISESTKANGNIMMELTSQTGETFWFNPARVVEEANIPSKPENNNVSKFLANIEESGLRVTQVVPLEVDATSKTPDFVKRTMAVKNFAKTHGLQPSGAYEGHFIKESPSE